MNEWLYKLAESYLRALESGGWRSAVAAWGMLALLAALIFGVVALAVWGLT